MTYNAVNNPPSFYNQFIDKLDSPTPESFTYVLSEDPEQNIRCFTYSLKSQMAAYQWRFELKNGTVVAPEINGSDQVGNTVTYDASNKPASEFVTGFADKVQLCQDTTNPGTITIDADESKNIYVFYYELKPSSTQPTKDQYNYEFRFKLLNVD